MPANDDPSPEELQQLNGFMATDTTVPPPDVEEGAPAASPTPVEPTVSPEAGAPAAPTQAPAPEQTDEERFAAWQAQHAGKTPEEMARLAFQQSQRASGAEARARQSGQSLAQINDRVKAASDRAATARQAVKDRQQRFDEQLQTDPDAATRALRDERDSVELARIDAEEHGARVEAAIGLASQALPDFSERAPAVFAFGGEMGYSKDELAGISDGRDLVVLSLADMAGRLIKGGLMDMKGNLISAPSPVAATPTDPRLTAPTPHQSLSSAPARPAASGRVPVQQATDLLSMSDADFSKLPPAELEALMRQLDG